MKIFWKVSVGAFVLALTLGVTGLLNAATTPSLGQAASFGILASTYTNTVSGTTITGNLGYTTGPAVAPTVNGSTYSPPASTYTTAGTDQGAALAALNSQACTHTFPAGAVDLATDTSHGTIGIYAPGVYCTTATSAASIGTGGITLSGSGTFIFRINGALTTVANSTVTLASSASACDVFWTPTAATTLGANSTFVGTNIDDSGITIGSTITWTGRALAFGGTISTTTDTITVPTCTPSTNANTNTNSNANTNTNSTPVANTNTNTSVTNTNTAGATAGNSNTSLPATGVAPQTQSGTALKVLAGVAAVTLMAVIARRKRIFSRR